ncbi:MAG TPA: thiamine pyrophosphate-binding protein, partial [Thermoanaerobaculia bacterium]|nr:thiamine pyrophosphate-binding protein [Thermoanaerobaculia bacterium]
EALRTSRLRTVVATHELASSFMANGYARASGRPGVLTTIPGPGFTYALTGLAEALLDSVPLVHVLVAPATAPGRRFQLQALDQKAIVSPVVKRVIDVAAAREIETAVRTAYAVCREGEPGPVVVQIPATLFDADVEAPSDAPNSDLEPAAPDVGPIARRLAAARRPLLYVGQGAENAANELFELVEATGAPVVTTTSARGVVPEDHPRVLRFDRRRTNVLEDLVESADLVLALGCKFSHNGAHGFRLRLPADRLVHVDASPAVLGANYEASLTLVADVPRVLRALLASVPEGTRETSRWTDDEMRSWKDQAVAVSVRSGEPRVRGYRPPTPEKFFASLRRTMPRDSCLVLDSGLHQMLARRYFRVLCPRGMLLPADLQAMGFALPAAIGARIANPRRPVVALLGDGGFALSGLELLTAVREHLPLTAIVFNDGRYGLIYNRQVNAYGRAHGTSLRNPDIRGVAESVGARYLRMSGRSERRLAAAIRGSGVTVVEVVLRGRGRRRLPRTARSVASRLKRWLLPTEKR